jgi:hypothetical protein
MSNFTNFHYAISLAQ